MYYHKEKHHQVNNSIICINAKNTLSGDLKEIENCSWATLYPTKKVFGIFKD